MATPHGRLDRGTLSDRQGASLSFNPTALRRIIPTSLLSAMPLSWPGKNGRALPGVGPVAKQQGAYVAKVIASKVT